MTGVRVLAQLKSTCQLLTERSISGPTPYQGFERQLMLTNKRKILRGNQYDDSHTNDLRGNLY